VCKQETLSPAQSVEQEIVFRDVAYFGSSPEADVAARNNMADSIAGRKSSAGTDLRAEPEIQARPEKYVKTTNAHLCTNNKATIQKFGETIVFQLSYAHNRCEAINPEKCSKSK